MAYVLYATKADVASFTGKSVDTLPVNTDTLIARASDLITNSIMIEITADHTEALKLATCAQVEYLFISGVQDENTDKIQSYSAGSVSVTYANSSLNKNLICIRARGYLNKVGLLYRGGRMTPKWTERSDELL